ncbi:glycine betaine ABC transporter substrate-binding protein [Methanoculleus sp. Afa-1]|uniref:Glycine betaine ABC transporter substrate-binding protein n=2 Tax=Methanoculleus formosensis TaxID=2590886 RepID=A0A9E4ZKP2_9EURY|nr:glycine betaine ABC transporter substrate-binding protein [Methanoculleus sp. Afa-1]
MVHKMRSTLVLAGILVLCLISAGCTGTEATEPKKEVSIGYVTWDCAIASSNVMKLVFEEAGYDVDMIAVDAGPLFQALARGDVDFTTTGWLPHTHESYWEQYGDQIDHVRANIPGAARIGLVVPTYVTIDSIEEMNGFTDRFGGRIVGIEPGAGVVARTEQAIDEYGLNYNLVTSSSAGMAAELGSSINDEEWVAVTGWSPHWKFGRYDLKFLDDEKGVYGGAEDIVTLARQDLATDDPEAHGILERFEWTGDDIASVMTDIAGGMPEEEAAQKWVDANRDKVDVWLGKA